ncbi:MAG: CRISPR-associated protein Csa3 [Methanothermococcus sp.]|uniref:CRISPR-associated CARF protein Csa3 n=1 Tax=Methanothermococcus TaxID=155862 RepID=UPI000380E775|nr:MULTISPECIES: CRISPR-associated CARF protein Csa3 [Methanothermococcus]MDK2790245.1 CRISPR-associated protein Csa3 [Methanothermococcus sp.]MDK2978634.1 CRISPR-associated protein Csa3 [Bacteroidales bacterium]MDK2987653.1 CRISPR-associated protein Csa3 [Methanothermococcus sp.]
MTTHIINMGFHTEHVYKPIAEFGAKKVVLIYSKDDEEYTSEEDFKKIDVALNKAKELCNMLGIDCEEVEVKGMEFEKNVEIFRELMQNENNRIIVNITGGRKITSFALLYASLYEFQKIDKIVYVHNKRIVEFPKIAHPYNLTKFERKILSSLNEGEKTITDLAKEFNVSLPAIVKYINSLEQKKLVKTHKIGRKRIVNII